MSKRGKILAAILVFWEGAMTNFHELATLTTVSTAATRIPLWEAVALVIEDWDGPYQTAATISFEDERPALRLDDIHKIYCDTGFPRSACSALRRRGFPGRPFPTGKCGPALQFQF